MNGDPMTKRPDAPEPHDTLQDEGGATAYWLASAWSYEDIEAEWDWMFEGTPARERLGELWLRPRWTTDEERGDPDTLYEMFGGEWESMDTMVAYDSAKPHSPGAHRYLTTEVAP